MWSSRSATRSRDLEVGSEVYGLIRFDRDGAAADYVAVPAADLARKPATVSHTVAAAVPLAALTAWQAWYDHAALRPGERVLVHGGAGGVGAFAVQLARACGAHVTATARGTDLALVRAPRGRAGHRLRKRRLDHRGTGVRRRPRHRRRPHPARLVHRAETRRPADHPAGATVAGAGSSTSTCRRHSSSSPPIRGQLAQLADLVDSGDLQVLIAATYPLAEGRAAFESATGPQRSPGKTVLVVRP